MHVFTVVTLLTLIPILNPPLVITGSSMSILLLASVVNFFAFLFLYRAFHVGIVSVVAPVAYTYPAVTSVITFLLFGLSFNTVQTYALILIVVGVMLVSMHFSELRNSSNRITTGLVPAIVASVSFGTVYVGVGYVTSIVGYFVPVIFLRSIGMILGFMFAPFFRQNIRSARKNITPRVIFMGILESLGLLFLTLGIELAGGEIPLVTALSSLGGAFATSYAILFMKEKIEVNQALGAVLAITGVFFLLYFSG